MTVLRSLRFGPTVLFVLVLAGLAAASSVVVVDDGQQAVIERMGKPVRVINRFRAGGPSGSGLVWKLPFVEQVIWLDRGLRGYSAVGQKVRSADAQDLLIDADLTYRIVDPVRLVNRLGSAKRLEAELGSLVPAILGGQLDRLTATDIAMPGSGGAARTLLAGIDRRAREFGVQVVDFRIGRVMPDDSGLQLTYEIMQGRHQREIDAIADARIAEAHQVRATVAAETGAIMQESAGKDPEFYDYFRALRSYDIVFDDPNAKNPPTIVIPPNSTYLRHLNGR